ncbi:MAG: transcription-repair coupling factor [Anaerolineae bacterium UTCFX2]|jgi:transcription-repair coupling factor (superfamily II helicase)|nr:MAG: transcription-repair coupling factor [Anaerolineae bacterium UTCFX2]
MSQHSYLEVLLQPVLRSCQPIIDAIRADRTHPPLGLPRAAQLPVLAALYQAYQQPFLLITDRTDRALTILDELGFWLPETPRLFFPEPNPLFYENAAWGDNIRRERLTALTTLAAYHIPAASRPEQSPVLVAPIRALMTRTLPRREFLKASRTLKTGQTLQLGELARLCVALEYEAANIVIAPGQFSRRGGILDIWPSSAALPIRVEFFGDEIDTMRSFDPSTQRTVHPQNGSISGRLLLTPAREFLPPPDFELQNPGQELNEFMIPLFHQARSSLLEYMPPASLVLLDNGQAVQNAIADIEQQAVELRQDSIAEGTLPGDFPVPYLTQEEIAEMIPAHNWLNLGPSLFDEDEPPATGDKTAISSRFQAGPRFSGRLKLFMEYLTARFQKGERLVVISRQCPRLKELWDEQRILANGRALPTFIEGSLSDGWDFQADDGQIIHLLTDGEVFGWRRPEPRRRPKRFAEAPEAGYADLQIDDFVVHIDHGIGRYTGLVRRSVEGVEREYLNVEFADEAQLFVPVHQADRLTRYVGPDSRQPTLSRLGSQEWRGVKANVKEAVQEIAEDLLKLYARRSIIAGHQFNSDSAWQKELEASFPYIETDDQMRVLAEVKQDMESARPMDRLICGDVGYGKTEVALRAAFKAVMDGRQVAILVPTTVLAQQHHQTFTERLAAFPVSVEMLSRFRSPQRQRQIVEELQKGKIDIVIGTHRMLSSDVVFKDLGLLVIDEEQRFGVTHKEQLKKIRTEVDVLTLTATPIPRTLYMALSGVRDISTINTPPEERLPIITHVGPYSRRLVKQAILREIERGGQVFFVHNRVQTIGAMHAHLKQLIPEARIAIAHGQLNETELADRMEAFTRAEIDVLLSTSIIESGLDIPNANTLIVDRADTFGLAQLYQLRGRVGRGAQRAYAYFFRHNRKSPSHEGRQRLETIAENTQLGAGYSIAMRDLEIRGTGDILGSRQHGHIAAVGFHLYTSLLSQAVQQLRKEHGLKEAPAPALQQLQLQLTPVNVELPLPTAIPADYVADKKVRLGLYRRMANLRTRTELEAMREELADRFGPVPEAVQNLFLQFKIKQLAERAGLSSISVENGQIVLRFLSGSVPEGLPSLAPLARAGKTAIWLQIARQPDWIPDLIGILEQLQQSKPIPSMEFVQ